MLAVFVKRFTNFMKATTLLPRFFSIIFLSAGTSWYFRYSGGMQWKPSILSGLSVLAILLAIWGFEVIRHGITPQPVKKKKDSFDWSMHYFRAFAIINILLLHIIGEIGHARFAQALFTTSTTYFLFISGYLCQYLDLKRPSAPLDYYRKKLQNVVLPYLICSAATCALIYLFGTNRVEIVGPSKLTPQGLVKVFAYGEAQLQYWYIPFVIPLFLLSPLFLKMKDQWLLKLTGIAFLLFVLFPQRPFAFPYEWPRTFYLYAHFTFAYLAGFVYCRHRSAIDPVISKWWYVFLAAGIIIALWRFWPGLLKLRLTDGYFAINFQKVCFTIAIIPLLNAIRAKRIAILDKIADLSFTLYFIHMFFVQDFINLKPFLSSIGISGFILESGLVVLFLVAVVGLSIVLKCALGRYSRSIIGS